MNECLEHRIQWEGKTIECPLCRIFNLAKEMSNDRTMYYGYEISRLIVKAAEQSVHRAQNDVPPLVDFLTNPENYPSIDGRKNT